MIQILPIFFPNSIYFPTHKQAPPAVIHPMWDPEQPIGWFLYHWAGEAWARIVPGNQGIHTGCVG